MTSFGTEPRHGKSHHKASKHESLQRIRHDEHTICKGRSPLFLVHKISLPAQHTGVREEAARPHQEAGSGWSGLIASF